MAWTVTKTKYDREEWILAFFEIFPYFIGVYIRILRTTRQFHCIDNKMMILSLYFINHSKQTILSFKANKSYTPSLVSK